jgi:hypothetical protein
MYIEVILLGNNYICSLLQILEKDKSIISYVHSHRNFMVHNLSSLFRLECQNMPGHLAQRVLTRTRPL